MKKEQEQGVSFPNDFKAMQQQLNEGSQKMTNSIAYITKVIQEKMAMISDDLPVKAELSKFLKQNK